jgi:hypothetical protein
LRRVLLLSVLLVVTCGTCVFGRATARWVWGARLDEMDVPWLVKYRVASGRR